MQLSDISAGKRAHISKVWNDLLPQKLPQAIVLEKIAGKLSLPVPLVHEFVKKQYGYPGRLSCRGKKSAPSLPVVRGVSP